MREWLSWWSTTLPRSGPRVRVPSRALFISPVNLLYVEFTGFFIIFFILIDCKYPYKVTLFKYKIPLNYIEITGRQMLMYSKEANNRKQEIDRQHHTIPNQRANDKHHGNVYNLLFRYGKVRSQNMEKLKSSFPTFCKRTFPQLHKIASYAHYAQCRLLRKPSHFIIYSRK